MHYMEDPYDIIWGLPKGDKPYLIFMDQGAEKGEDNKKGRGAKYKSTVKCRRSS